MLTYMLHGQFSKIQSHMLCLKLMELCLYNFQMLQVYNIIYLCLNLGGQMMEMLTSVTVKSHWPCKFRY